MLNRNELGFFYSQLYINSSLIIPKIRTINHEVLTATNHAILESSPKVETHFTIQRKKELSNKTISQVDSNKKIQKPAICNKTSTHLKKKHTQTLISVCKNQPTQRSHQTKDILPHFFFLPTKALFFPFYFFLFYSLFWLVVTKFFHFIERKSKCKFLNGARRESYLVRYDTHTNTPSCKTKTKKYSYCTYIDTYKSRSRIGIL